MTARGRRRALFGLVAVAALNGVVYAAYTFPRTREERHLVEHKAALQQEVQQGRRQVAGLKAQTDVAESNRADVETFYTKAVTVRTTSLVPVLREVESLAREGGLHPGDAAYSAEPVKGGDLERFKITMPVAGNYRQVVNFIERLEGSAYFLTLDEVQVRSTAQGGKTELALALSCYFRSPGARQAARQP